MSRRSARLALTSEPNPTPDEGQDTPMAVVSEPTPVLHPRTSQTKSNKSKPGVKGACTKDTIGVSENTTPGGKRKRGRPAKPKLADEPGRSTTVASPTNSLSTSSKPRKQQRVSDTV
jgi:hypothetical protein